MPSGASSQSRSAPEGMREETEEAVKDFSITADQAMEAGRLINGQQSGAGTNASSAGYDEKERDALEQLIERQGDTQ